MDKRTFIQKAALMQPLYTPSQAVKLQLSQVDLIAAVGPTGVGKTTIMGHSGIPFVTSDGTRDLRKGETSGTDYNLRSDFDTLMAELEAGQFVQYIVNTNDEFYGTKASSYPVSGPCTMSIIATAISQFTTFGFHQLLPVYIIPPSYEEWMRRIRAHRDKDLPARLIEAKISLETALQQSNFHFMINDNLLTACERFRSIAHGTADDRNDQDEARHAALQLLTGIESSSPGDFSGLL